MAWLAQSDDEAVEKLKYEVRINKKKQILDTEYQGSQLDEQILDGNTDCLQEVSSLKL